jgi:hypothetical protein
MIANKTQLQKDIDSIDQASDVATLAASAFAKSLNNLFDALWSLPEDRLINLLQYMYDQGIFETMFGKHNYAATSINNILTNSNSSSERAKDSALREIIIADGIVSLGSIPTQNDI